MRSHFIVCGEGYKKLFRVVEFFLSGTIFDSLYFPIIETVLISQIGKNRTVLQLSKIEFSMASTETTTEFPILKARTASSSILKNRISYERRRPNYGVSGRGARRILVSQCK